MAGLLRSTLCRLLYRTAMPEVLRGSAGLSLFFGFTQLVALGAFERALRFFGRGLGRARFDVLPHALAIVPVGGPVTFALVLPVVRRCVLHTRSWQQDMCPHGARGEGVAGVRGGRVRATSAAREQSRRLCSRRRGR